MITNYLFLDIRICVSYTFFNVVFITY